MKTINLLKEGHGLRYDAAPPDAEEPSARGPSGRPSRGPKGPAAGKIIVLLAVLALLGGGGWWLYRSFDTLAPRIAAIKASLVRSKEKPPAEPRAPEQPAGEAAPADKAAPAAGPQAPAPSGAVTLASDVGLWYRSDADYPYAIVVASFRKEEAAAAYAKKLLAQGHATTVAPTDLGDKGRWFRVVLGRYGALGEVREANSKLKESQSFKDTWATKLPYAVEVGIEPDKASAEAARDALSGKGAYAVVFPEASGPDQPVTFRLLAGAFSSKAQADDFASSLRQRGMTPKVVSP